MTRLAVMTTGLPGSGKTTASRLLAERLDATAMGIGEEVRQRATADLGRDPAGKEIGEWLRGRFDRYGPGLFARFVIDRLDRADPATCLVVDGVRTPETVDVLDNFADRTVHLRLDAPFSTRFDRIRDRDRDGEATYDEAYLRWRDACDRSYGLTRVWQECPVDHRIDNDGTLDGFRAAVSDVATVVAAGGLSERPPETDRAGGHRQ